MALGSETFHSRTGLFLPELVHTKVRLLHEVSPICGLSKSMIS
jgi:hypothetical protein